LPDLTKIAARIAAKEAVVPDLRPGCEKQIVWADASALRTRYALLFIHGFSASPQEIRPLPDFVAQQLGANLYLTRLTGHGRDGPAMGEATLAAWQEDVAEALDVAAELGEKVIIMGCSTGCTLATLALAKGADAQAVIHISPNFGLAHRVAQWLLDAPGARIWGQFIAGHQRSFPVISDSHAAYWTTTYPTKAVHVMADAVRAARKADLAQINTPALFCYNPADQVVSARATRAAMAQWGGPTAEVVLQQTAEDDKMGHVMAGNVFSPGQTAPLAQRIMAWLTNVAPD